MSTYTTTLTWTGGNTGTSSCAGKPDIAINPPTEFGGDAALWTPEDLLVSAVETCLMLTALSVLNRQKIAITSYRSTATGTMEKTPQGLRFTALSVAIEVRAAEADREKAEKAVHLAEKYCPVSNALNIPVQLTVTT